MRPHRFHPSTPLAAALLICGAVALAGCAEADPPEKPAASDTTKKPSNKDEKPTADSTADNSATNDAGAANTPVSYDLDSPDSVTVLVNKQRPLNPISYEPGDLVLPSLPNPNGQPVRQVMLADLERLAADAVAAGLPQPILSSGYRSYQLQESLFANYSANYGVAAADQFSARPGHSEHQTGLAVDLDDGSGCNLQACFGDTALGQWLRDNAHRYGFVLRYTEAGTPITGYTAEPWHFRYVGVEVAEAVRASGAETLEQFFGIA